MKDSKRKKIPGFSQYTISQNGDIFRNGEKLSPAKNEDDYATVVLYKNGEPYHKYVHRLVADAWGVEGSGEIVNHKDGDKSNINPDNLGYVDPGESTRHAYRKGLASGCKGEDNGRSKLTKKEVESIRKSKKSGTSLARLYDVNPTTISLIKHGKRW